MLEIHTNSQSRNLVQIINRTDQTTGMTLKCKKKKPWPFTDKERINSDETIESFIMWYQKQVQIRRTQSPKPKLDPPKVWPKLWIIICGKIPILMILVLKFTLWVWNWCLGIFSPQTKAKTPNWFVWYTDHFILYRIYMVLFSLKSEVGQLWYMTSYTLTLPEIHP